MNTPAARNAHNTPQNSRPQAREHNPDAPPRDHPLDKAQDHIADLTMRLDALRQRLGPTLDNNSLAEFNAVVTELQSLAELRNAPIDPNLPPSTAGHPVSAEAQAAHAEAGHEANHPNSAATRRQT